MVVKASSLNGKEEIIYDHLTSPDDSSAFILATKTYWSRRGTSIELNGLAGGDRAIPYSFILFKFRSSSDSTPVIFSKNQEERLIGDIEKYYRERELAMDSIFSGRENLGQ